MTQTLFLGSALVTGLFSGYCLASSVMRYARRPKRSRRFFLEQQFACNGLMAFVLEQACRETLKGLRTSRLTEGVVKAFQWRSAWVEKSIELAGLADKISKEALCTLRGKLAAGGAAGGLLIGLSLSNELGILLMLIGGLGGAGIVKRALQAEISHRRIELEKSLPEMFEALSLCLRSGLSFERSFELYHQHFNSRLAQESASVHQRWVMGFSSREDALRLLAHAYDSKLLARFSENAIRSLRFGSSLVETLDEMAAEARELRRARLQELIAKAPVKMMLPTGTLILPAMLLLVLGPVLLELMEGF